MWACSCHGNVWVSVFLYDCTHLQGEDLTAGATVHDYTVTVGSGVCTGLTLFQNALSCYPPTVEPVKEAATSRDGAHNVYVSD